MKKCFNFTATKDGPKSESEWTALWNNCNNFCNIFQIVNFKSEIEPDANAIEPHESDWNGELESV